MALLPAGLRRCYACIRRGSRDQRDAKPKPPPADLPDTSMRQALVLSVLLAFAGHAIAASATTGSAAASIKAEGKKSKAAASGSAGAAAAPAATRPKSKASAKGPYSSFAAQVPEEKRPKFTEYVGKLKKLKSEPPSVARNATRKARFCSHPIRSPSILVSLPLPLPLSRAPSRCPCQCVRLAAAVDPETPLQEVNKNMFTLLGDALYSKCARGRRSRAA